MPYKDRAKQRAYQRRWMRKRREAWFGQSGPCSRCGSIAKLQLHHTVRGKKVSHKVWSWAEKRRRKELAKCVVVCRRCHNIESMKEGTLTPPTHGTMGRYVFGGCRCALCVARRRAYWKYCRLRRKTRERGVKITRGVENALRRRVGYPRKPPKVVVEIPRR